MLKQSSVFKFLIFPLLLTALTACGNTNDVPYLTNSSGNHPANWIKQHGAIAATSSTSCAECHGENFTGGISRVGCFSTPAMARNGFACHVTSPVINSTGCTSCHNIPPNGSFAPNRAGSHAKHLALAGVTCASCHQGGGAGTADHANGVVKLSLPDNLKAKTFTTFGYDAASGSCSGISCHGGQATPSWESGKINVTSDCTTCHIAGTSQFNGFFSGTYIGTNLHTMHLSRNVPNTTILIACSDCHNTTVLAANHFTGLFTSAFEGSAAITIGGDGTKITNYIPYSLPGSTGSCTSTCHNSLVFDWIN
ncbi:MAG: CxxxxCH/CxxCH domain-containing protein [Desulfuromonadaceae bacterium]|nr:CxxxxCH/CxxCH domain-containing protein [Desulfuromonadaceae bacterium]